MAIETALVVDDSRLARLTLARLLERRNIRVEQAESGHAAIDYLRDHRPDVVFMDYQMPDMDGIEAIGTITRNPDTAQLPVYLFTAEEGDEIRQRARSVGARGLLLKPTPDELLDRVLGEAAATGSAPAPAAPVVDVDARVQDTLERLLGQAEEQRLVPLVRKTTAEAVEGRLTELWSPLLAEVRKAAQEAARAEFQTQGAQLEQQITAAAREAAQGEFQAQRPQLEEAVVVAAQRTAREAAGAMAAPRQEQVTDPATVELAVDERLRQALGERAFQEQIRTLVQQAVDRVGEGAARQAAAAAEQGVEARIRAAVEEAVGGLEARVVQIAEQRARQAAEQAAPPPVPAPEPAPAPGASAPAALWVVAALGVVLGGAALALVFL